MSVGANYYALQLKAQNTNLPAYYYVNLASSGAVSGSAVTIYPDATSATYVAQSSSYLQFQAPQAQQIGAGITVVTNASNVAGTLGASPPLNSPVTLQCFGAGKLLGVVVLQPGQSEAPFDFRVDASESIPASDIAEMLAKLVPRP